MDPWDDQASALAEAVNAVEGGNASAAENKVVPMDEDLGIVIATEEDRLLPGDFQLPEFREDLVVVDTSLDPKNSVIIKAAKDANSCRIDGLEVTACIMALNFRILPASKLTRKHSEKLLMNFLITKPSRSH